MNDRGVFDAGEREDDRPGGHAESYFCTLNRRSGPRAVQARELVETWWEHLAVDQRSEVRARLRSGSDVNFRSAFFELYCHEIFRRDGWSVSPHPNLEGTSLHPDFALQRGEECMVVEATGTSRQQEEDAADRRAATLLDAVNGCIPHGDFHLGVDVVRIGRSSGRSRRLVAFLTSWLDSLDADELLIRGPDRFETTLWTDQGWEIEFDAYPTLPEHRGKPGRVIGTHSVGGADFIDDIAPLRRRVDEKSSRYGRLGRPYVIAIDQISGFVSDGDIVSSLYGSSAVRYYVNPGPNAPAPWPVRMHDGALLNSHGWRRTHVSALLTTTRLSPWTVLEVTPTWWLHPAADHPAPRPPKLCRIATVNAASGQLEYTAADSSPTAFFHLADG